jgi:hypothetical protein
MQLEALRVLHLPKAQVEVIERPAQEWNGAFHLNTCQRWIWIWNSESKGPSFLKDWSSRTGSQIFSGRDAYLFLLRLATGLESKIVGETDIFGQFKLAWKNRPCQELSSWIQRIFEDTKEIRSIYLQNLGGASYGSLVRKLMKETSSSFCGPTLIVGAGQIAQSVAPFLLESELWIGNRNLENLDTFYNQLSQRHVGNFRKLETQEQEIQGWRTAKNIVVCIPVDAQVDAKRCEWFREGGIEGRCIVHLGGLKHQCGDWNELPQFYALDDLFLRQNELGNVRSVQISRAEKACIERAQLRQMGTSLSIPHGWEDLACFAYSC